MMRCWLKVGLTRLMMHLTMWCGKGIGLALAQIRRLELQLTKMRNLEVEQGWGKLRAQFLTGEV